MWRVKKKDGINYSITVIKFIQSFRITCKKRRWRLFSATIKIEWEINIYKLNRVAIESRIKLSN